MPSRGSSRESSDDRFRSLATTGKETKVGFIEFQDRQSPYFSKARPLKELAVHFDKATARAK